MGDVTQRESGFRTRDSKMRITVVGVLAALPCIALAAISAWWFAGGLAGRGLWPADRVTLAEAVATRNNAEALRLISLGANPNEPSHVRDGLLTDGYDVVVTPIEAAVGAQRADTLQMLLANGAIVDEPAQLLVLRCYERMRRDSGVREILNARASRLLETMRGVELGRTAEDRFVQSALSVEPDCTGVHLPSERRAD
jgi:hypothetical protein